jgi:hypothetical protein
VPSKPAVALEEVDEAFGDGLGNPLVGDYDQDISRGCCVFGKDFDSFEINQLCKSLSILQISTPLSIPSTTCNASLLYTIGQYYLRHRFGSSCHLSHD